MQPVKKAAKRPEVWQPTTHSEQDVDQQSESQETGRQQEGIDPYLYDLQQSENQRPTVDMNGDVLYAYKELKKIMTKNQGSKMGADQVEGPKNYLRTTIAMQ